MIQIVISKTIFERIDAVFSIQLKLDIIVFVSLNATLDEHYAAKLYLPDVNTLDVIFCALLYLSSF